jgi:excisionase family DNA binding protein
MTAAMTRALPDPATEPTITIARAAAILGVGTRTAYYAAERGEIPTIRDGLRVCVPTGKFLRQYGLLEEAT